ncbi:MAG: hypothetical protein QOI59_3612 [Gammaproteobacteria bacterium]|nr:hypothetical protein [Gammaproteobacteria bacterium]
MEPQAGPDRHDWLLRRCLLDHRRRLGPARRLPSSRRSMVARPRAAPADAPPLFTAVAQDDRLFFPSGRGPLCRLVQCRSPAELHIFTRGGHGLGVGTRGLPVDHWTDLLGNWLAGQEGAPRRTLPDSYWRETAPFKRSRNSSVDKLSECRRLVASLHADMSLARRTLRIYLTNVQSAKMSWLSRISWLGSELRPRKQGRSA